MTDSEAKLRDAGDLPEIQEVLQDPAASLWLKQALSSALLRDPVDAINEAEVLVRLLDERCRVIINQGRLTDENS